MQISAEGKIGYALALFGLFGAGVLVVSPTLIWVGWLMMGVSIIGAILLVFHHYWQPLRSLAHKMGKRKMLGFIGLFLSAAGFAISAYAVMTPSKGRQGTAPDNTTGSVSFLTDKGNLQSLLVNKPLSSVALEYVDDSENGREFTNKTLDYFNDMRIRENPIDLGSFMQPYVGMLIKITGFLDNKNILYTTLGYYMVAINFNGGPTKGGMLLLCKYPNKYKNYLSGLKPNQEITGIGTIVNMAGYNFELNGCHPITQQSAPLPSLAPPPPPEKK